MYREQIREHFANPRNAGSTQNPSGRAIVRSPVDSDTVLMTLPIENEVIQDVRFKCMGCAVAIACSSMATEMVLGKHVDEAYEITKQRVADSFCGIPEYKMVCSNLAPDGMRMAIDDWRRRQEVPGAGGIRAFAVLVLPSASELLRHLLTPLSGGRKFQAGQRQICGTIKTRRRWVKPLAPGNPR